MGVLKAIFQAKNRKVQRLSPIKADWHEFNIVNIFVIQENPVLQLYRLLAPYFSGYRKKLGVKFNGLRWLRKLLAYLSRVVILI